MDYNTSRKDLVLPEYGRHIQKLVNHLKTIEDRDERSRTAHALIPIMAQVNTNLKENGDFKHKLWDHLFIMSDFDLDIDAPYEMPEKEALFRKPDPLPYTQEKFKKKHYGKIIKKMMDQIDNFEGDEQQALIELLANQLKKSYTKWNKETVNDDLILNDFIELAEKEIKFRDDLKLVEVREIVSRPIKKKKTNRKNRN